MLAWLAETQPDVAILDYQLPLLNGVDATRQIRAFQPQTEVLIFTMHTEEELLLPLLRSGARGYLAKDAADRELVDAIRVVASGEVYVRPAVARLLARAFAPPRDPVPASDSPETRFESLSAGLATTIPPGVSSPSG